MSVALPSPESVGVATVVDPLVDEPVVLVETVVLLVVPVLPPLVDAGVVEPPALLPPQADSSNAPRAIAAMPAIRRARVWFIVTSRSLRFRHRR